MGTAKRITFEGTKDEVVAEALAWAEVDDLWDAHSLDERIDVMDLLDAPGCSYEIEDVDSELPGQCDQWMTFVVTDEAKFKKGIRENIEAFLNPKPRKRSRDHLRLVKG